HADTEAVESGVGGSETEIIGAWTLERRGGDFRNAAEAEAAHEDGHAGFQICDGGVGRRDALVHGRRLREATGRVYRSRKVSRKDGSIPRLGRMRVHPGILGKECGTH